MAKEILVPVDGSPPSFDAVDFVLDEYPDASLVLLHVVDPIEAGYSAPVSMPGASEEWYESAKEEAEALFEKIRERTAGSDLTVSTTVEMGRPARVIVEYAEENDVDQIVIGSHGRSGVSRILLGSVAEIVIRRSPCPVTVVR